ncbi:MAG: hypothetical protein N2544_08680 [Burkholderiales bacterium]|nr:hypothetical protein [Burkholderiales bacterium]
MADLQTVFAKTPAGLGEVQAKAHALSRPQRNLLILADGKSPLGNFARMVGGAPEELVGIAQSLVALGLIAPAGSAAASGPASRPPGAAGPAKPGGEALRASLVALAEDTFGGKAGKVVEKLNAAGAHPAELLSAVESGAKLAKLTIDEAKAAAFLAGAKKILEGAAR